MKRVVDELFPLGGLGSRVSGEIQHGLQAGAVKVS
jgi:hypothetical protein